MAIGIQLAKNRELPRVCETVGGTPYMVNCSVKSEKKYVEGLAEYLAKPDSHILFADGVEKLLNEEATIEQLEHVHIPHDRVWVDFRQDECVSYGVDAVALPAEQLKTWLLSPKLLHITDPIKNFQPAPQEYGLVFKFFMNLSSKEDRSYFYCLGPVMLWAFFVSKEGKVNCDFSYQFHQGNLSEEEQRRDRHVLDEISEGCHFATHICMKAFSMLGYSNVKMIRGEGTADEGATEREQKLRQRMPFSYHVIKVVSGNREVALTGRKAPEKVMGEHDVRRHERRYHVGPHVDGAVNPKTEVRLILPFIRGKREVGKISKDYEVVVQ